MTRSIRSLVVTLTVVLASVSGLRAESGAELYASKCKKCHAEDGSGKTKMGEKLKLEPLDQAMSDDQWLQITRDGKDKMPKYSDKLTDDQIKGIIAHMRTLK